MKISVKEIKKILERDLIDNGEMSYGLYEYELEERIEYFKASIREDNDDFLFSVTVNRHIETNQYVTAMVLVEKSGAVHINEAAREFLQNAWKHNYLANIKRLIPDFAKQLRNNELPINGVKIQAPF